MNISILETKPTSVETHVGKSLEIACNVHGVSGATVADSLGMTRQNFHKIFKQRSVAADRLKELAELFNMSVEKFLSLPHAPISYGHSIDSLMLINHFTEALPEQGKFIQDLKATLKESQRLVEMLESAAKAKGEK